MPSEEREKSRGLYWVAVVLAVVPLAYVLSVGPVAMVCQQAGLTLVAVDLFYYPLHWLHDNTPLREPLRWYVQLWGVR